MFRAIFNCLIWLFTPEPGPVCAEAARRDAAKALRAAEARRDSRSVHAARNRLQSATTEALRVGLSR